MGVLDGSVHTPFGEVSKKTAVIGGGAVLMIAGIIFYRSRKASQAADAAATAATAGANTGIDPATGYAYGSAEDAAALTAQGSFVSPGSTDGIFGGGGSVSNAGTNTGPGTFTSNSAWAQYVETYMVNNGLVSDPTLLSAAIGKYLNDIPITDPNMVTLVQQAIAVGDKPPIAGLTGYPPSINTSNPSTGGTTTTPTGSVLVAMRKDQPSNGAAIPYKTASTSWTDIANEHYTIPTGTTATVIGGTLAHANGLSPSDNPKGRSLLLPQKLTP